MFANWNLIIPIDKDRASSSSSSRSPAIKKARISSVTYPRCLALTSSTASTAPPSPPDFDTITQIFTTIKKHTDITAAHLSLLNVSYSYDLPLSSIIPTKYHADENEADDRSIFNQRKKEVTVENQDAYDFIARKRRDIKIGNFYKFYQTAEMVELLLSSDSDSSSNSGTAAASSTPVSPPNSREANLEMTAAARSAARYREDLLRNFVDPIAWGYDMRIYPPRYQPRLLSRKSLFNAKVDLYVHLQPPTMQERKEGIVIGPAVVLQTRNEDKYSETDDLLDAVHELSALLTFGQERSRKGTHKKVVYKAIGKDKDIGGDDLFLISSVHHHIALSHVFITDAFTKFIRTGELPPKEYIDLNPDWCCCRIGRTKWYSLLDAEGRVEALRAVMALFNWLKREN
ncbi:hypothetical protein TWF694_009799 [Orbilia ellipsospora]|uniref:Uncharacterized protein n=1 Tax=Orbilia ellipsospora TaxID=2528407 RepID=A0AAV9XBX5_9PEZI